MSAGTKAPIASSVPAGAMAMALAQDGGPVQPDNKAGSHSFVGLWDSKVSYQGQVIDEGFDAFHSDGTEILVDESAPATDNVCLGTYEQTGPATIKVKHPSWYFDLNGNLLGVVIIRETLTLDCDGESFHGTSSEDVYDTNGNKVGHYDGFKVEAKRIKVD